MKILIIGSGGREHSLALKLKENPRVKTLYFAPGNAGTQNLGENIAITETDLQKLLNFALEKKIDLTVVGPETSLVAGIADIFEGHGLKIIGPYKNAAKLEGSKKWAKTFMTKYNIPTAKHESFHNFESAYNYLTRHNHYPIVIKADGLAAGKGVTVAASEQEARTALENCFIYRTFHEAGDQIIIEDYLSGEEASILAFTDGHTILPMVAAQDHKAVFDNDQGPNTGGMGAYSPAPIVTPKVLARVQKRIFEPLLKGLKQEGIIYKGIIYAGLMIQNETPSVIEFNVRFGDPETQVVLPRLKTDLLDIFLKITERKLSDLTLEWEPNATICVVLTSSGYPGHYEKGKPIQIPDSLKKKTNIQIIHAGTRYTSDKTLVTNGGRVIGVVSSAPNLQGAIKAAYSAANQISFENKFFRKDIGAKALIKEPVIS